MNSIASPVKTNQHTALAGKEGASDYFLASNKFYHLREVSSNRIVNSSHSLIKRYPYFNYY